MSTPLHIATDTGTRDSLTWEFDGIRMGHGQSPVCPRRKKPKKSVKCNPRRRAARTIAKKTNT